MRKNKIILLIALFVILFNISGCLPKELSPASEEDLLESFLEDEEIEIQEEEEAIFAYSDLSDDIIDKIIGVSYIENDNVFLEDLSYIQVTHWGFDDKEHIGEIIVNSKVAEDIVEIFKELYEAKFPIEKIRLIDEYGADDDLSMMDNNSSSFCYREVAGSNKLSNHSYGIAIDINPVQNPYIKGNVLLPSNGEEYLDRENIRKGMITEGDPCYNAFVSRGWTWGGHWNSLKDYQHFEFNLD